MPALLVQLCICGIYIEPGRAGAAGAAPNGRETPIWAVPSPRNKDIWDQKERSPHSQSGLTDARHTQSVAETPAPSETIHRQGKT